MTNCKECWWNGQPIECPADFNIDSKNCANFKSKESLTGIDNVNHPSHYETGNFECIDVMIETQGKDAVMNFCICNAFKYLYRHNRKNKIEDIKKAKWYIDKYIELFETEQRGLKEGVQIV